MSPPELSICVPAFDNRNLPVLVDAVEAHTGHIDYELVVVHCGGRIRGYTAPQNQALKAGRGDFLLALNDDVIVTDGWIDPLLAAGRAGGWVVTPDGSHTDGPQVFHPYCLLWSRAAFAALRGYDEQFQVWCSDIDLARRLEQAGHPPVIVRLPVPIRHALNATTADPLISATVSAIAQADLKRYVQKWGADANDDKARLACASVS